uniref:CDP-diacylglycerol-glycerol-3-phosphate 3-phosphatidyltransferase n=1 Tax=Kalanchoe fedtschenkoi TaxID=63787 RepID=A0A7N0VMH8_KALFE
MEVNNSYTSWADQWDTRSDYPGEPKHNSGGGGAEKYKKKVGEGLEKTKTVAATGFKKVKVGTSAGLHWIKDKYHKTTSKN